MKPPAWASASTTVTLPRILLAKGGVDYVQGHHVGQPSPVSTGLPAV